MHILHPFSSLPLLLLLTPLLLLLAIFFTSTLLLFPRLLITWKRTRLPPAPPKLPIIGNLHQLSSYPHRSLLSLSNKYGPIMLLHIGQIPTLIISSSEFARQILKEQDHIFANRPSMNVPRALLYKGKDIAFAPYTEYWRKVRKLGVLHLLSHKKVQSYRTIREEELKYMIDKVSNMASLGVSINLTKILNSFAKDIILRVVLGKCMKGDSWSNEIGKLIEESSGLLGAFHWGDYFPWLAWMSDINGLNKRVQQLFEKVDELLDTIVETHRQKNDVGHENATFVDILLSLEKEISCSFPFDKENIKAILEDMVGAGTDSTYITMEWVMAELLRNPHIMAKLKAEITSTVLASNPRVEEHHLPHLPYLKAIIKESFRLHPTGPLLVPRESMHDTHIQGYRIPKHTRVLINTWAIGRDPKLWECAERFMPERFLGCEIDFKGQDYQLIPFGAGRRMCPGIQFAMSIVELGIANLVHQFEWKLEGSMKGEDMDMGEAPGLTCRKKVNLHAVATRCFQKNIG